MQGRKLKKEKSIAIMLKCYAQMQGNALDQNWELFRKEHKKMLEEALKLKKLLSNK